MMKPIVWRYDCWKTSRALLRQRVISSMAMTMLQSKSDEDKRTKQYVGS